MTQDLQFDGVPIKFGRTSAGQPRVLVLPPLSFKALKQYRKDLQSFDDNSALSDEAIDLVQRLTEAALKRNYPDMDFAFLEDVLDAGNMMHVMQCIVDVSGLKRKEYETEIKGTPADPLIGANSTAS